jgi:NAD(P)-dependent dehydrogenase (short-subunit alcohol dehydrogenase family)
MAVMDPELVGKVAMRSRIPLRCLGQQAVIANGSAFPCSAQSNYVTGEAMNVLGAQECH